MADAARLKELFPRAMRPGFPAEIQLTRDEMSRMRSSLIDPLHFLLFTLLPAANCLAEVGSSHLYKLALASAVRCGLSATFSGNRRRSFETGILGCGRLLGRSCYGAQTMARFRFFPNPKENKESKCACDFRCGSGHKAKMQRCAVTQWSTRCLLLAEVLARFESNGCLFLCAGHAQSARCLQRRVCTRSVF